jgi:hypothetical protein
MLKLLSLCAHCQVTQLPSPSQQIHLLTLNYFYGSTSLLGTNPFNYVIHFDVTLKGEVNERSEFWLECQPKNAFLLSLCMV